MKNKSKAKVRAKKIESFKISPSGMGYVELYNEDLSDGIKASLKELVDDNAHSKGHTSSSATVDELEGAILAMKVNLSGEGSPAETLLEEIIKKAKRLGYDELTFNW